MSTRRSFDSLASVRLGRLSTSALRAVGLEVRRVRRKAAGSEQGPGTLKGKQAKRTLYFQQLVALIEDVPGDIVECGVGGGTTMALLLNLSDGETPRRVWGFDSFAGLPPPSPEDEPERTPETIRAGLFSWTDREVRRRLRVEYGVSRRTLKERVTLVPGYFPQRFPEYTGGQIAFLHLDVDLYQSYKDCLEWFEPKVVPGGIIAFDEYRSRKWLGATRAIEEYYGCPPPGIRQLPCWDKWFLVKGESDLSRDDHRLGSTEPDSY